VETLLGDATRAQEKLGWKPRVSLQELVSDMVRSDFAEAKAEMESSLKRRRTLFE
jgi:GDPmannose 4,6-dehydratase